jgi:hypothetical protein
VEKEAAGVLNITKNEHRMFLKVKIQLNAGHYTEHLFYSQVGLCPLRLSILGFDRSHPDGFRRLSKG